MKKKFTLPLLAICAVAAVLLFVNFGRKEKKSKQIVETTLSTPIPSPKWKLQKVDNFKIMTVSPNGNWLTDIMRATLSKRIEDGNLPISFSISISGEDAPTPIVGMACRIKYDNIEMENDLRNFQATRDDSTFVANGLFTFDFSKTNSADLESLYSLSALSSDHLSVWVKPQYQENKESEWHELECKH